MSLLRELAGQSFDNSRQIYGSRIGEQGTFSSVRHIMKKAYVALENRYTFFQDAREILSIWLNDALGLRNARFSAHACIVTGVEKGSVFVRYKKAKQRDEGDNENEWMTARFPDSLFSKVPVKGEQFLWYPPVYRDLRRDDFKRTAEQ